MTNRDTLLEQKRQELEEQLTQWAKDQNILEFDERLTFMVEIKLMSVPRVHGLIKSDVSASIIPDGGGRKRAFRYIRPAALSPQEIEVLLSNFTDKCQAALQKILCENKNLPSRERWKMLMDDELAPIYYASRDINTKLKKLWGSDRGFQLAVETLRNTPEGETTHIYQLWEILPLRAT